MPKLKLNDEGSALAHVTHEGGIVPVLVHDDGTEAPLDALKLIAGVKSASDRAEEMKKKLEASQGRLTKLDELLAGEDDLDAFFERARKDRATVEGLDAGDLTTKEEREKLEAQIAKQYEEREKRTKAAHEGVVKKLQDDLTTANTRRLDLLKSTHFNGSEFVRSLTSPPDMVMSTFGPDFYEDGDGKLRAKDENGEPIRSRTDPSQLADFDEAMKIKVDSYAHKDKLLPRRGGPGPGTPPHSTSGSSTKSSILRSEFDNLSPARKAEIAADIRSGKVEVVDRAA